ncbi:MAG TPA: DUF72 domain-containing protein [Methylomirabilota bacterium]|nr:DUF72 domain-containing protein [Methylomirabilota bacterium]
MSTSLGKVRVGTASWADPGFVEAWYPRKLPANERLSYYAEHFNFVELNSSFYGIPAQRQVERWAEQTPKGFVFDVKLHKLLSRHSTKLENLPPKLHRSAKLKGSTVLLTAELESAVADEFLEQIEPLRSSGKLGALLLQLSPGFSPRSHQLAELEPLLGRLHEYTLGVELRNRNWVTGEQLAQTEQFFKDHNLTYVAVDAPRTEHFTVMPELDLVTNTALGYMRLHGRNAEGYIKGKTVADRFNYQYSDEEIKEITSRALQMAKRAKEVHIVYNNNARDYAIRSAITTNEVLMETAPEALAPIPKPPKGPMQKELL